MNGTEGGSDGATALPEPPSVALGRLRARMTETASAPKFWTPGSGRRRRRALADLAVESLTTLWSRAADGISATGVALVALGSLGRGEPGPMSDLDLMIVHDGSKQTRAQLEALASAVWYPIWDAGLSLDHAVRSLDEWREVASHDLPAAVGMLHVRTIAGDDALVGRAMETMLGDWRRAARTRFEELATWLRSRWDRAGEFASPREPDLKESRGGIRDAVVLDALAATWLADRPHGAVDAAASTLLDARDALELVTGRHTTKLTRQSIDEVARRCDADDIDDFQADLAGAGRRVAYSLDVTVRRSRRALQRSSPAILRPRFIRGKRAAPMLRKLGPDLVEHDGELVLSMDADTASSPLLPLRAAAAAVSEELPLSPVTAEHLGECPSPPEPWPAPARTDFCTLLASGRRQIPVWESLDLAGVVVRWIPEWAAIRNRLQRAPIHRYTVDRHCVEVVAQIADADEWGIPAVGTEQWRVRLLAALLHDVGKRPHTLDHAVEGAALVRPILARMGFDEKTIGDVALLVREHLVLSELAVTEDPDDPETVETLVRAVDGREDLLHALAALTKADTIALGGRRWTPWRAQLVGDLVVRTEARIRASQPSATH